METIKVRMNEHPELIFHIDISGTSDPITEVRLTVHDDRKISYLGKYRDGKAYFHVDEIERYFKAGIFKYELEVFIGNQYFIPLSGQLEVSDGVKVIAQHPERVDETPKIEAQFEMRKGLPVEPVVKAAVIDEKQDIKVPEKPVEKSEEPEVKKSDKPEPKSSTKYVVKIKPVRLEKSKRKFQITRPFER